MKCSILHVINAKPVTFHRGRFCFRASRHSEGKNHKNFRRARRQRTAKCWASYDEIIGRSTDNFLIKWDLLGDGEKAHNVDGRKHEAKLASREPALAGGNIFATYSCSCRGNLASFATRVLIGPRNSVDCQSQFTEYNFLRLFKGHAYSLQRIGCIGFTHELIPFHLANGSFC